MTNENMLPVGTLLRGGTYKITRQLASGGFGNTYVVENTAFSETYAMKEFFMKGVNLRQAETVTVSTADNKATFESQKNKLKKEAQRLRKLNNEHIVRVHDLFEERGTVYYVMDFIDGESLDERLKRTRMPIEEREALGFVRQVLSALLVVHRQQPQLLHLDIKPANIMVDRQGCAYLIDFGASKQLSIGESMTLSTSTGMSYTAGYAPAEQLEQNMERMGPWTDYYALGATLYRLLTLRQPPSPSEISEDADEAFSFPSTMSVPTQRLIKWMMQPNRKKRPQTAQEILDAMDKDEQREEQPAQPAGDEATNYARKVTAAADESTVYDTKDERQGKNNAKRVSMPVVAAVVAVIVILVGVGISMGWGGESDKDSPHPMGSDQHTEAALRTAEDDAIVQNLLSNMVRVEGGTFTMGATAEQGGDAYDNEKPAHQVTLSSFSIGKYEVTQEEWEAVMGSNPSYFPGSKRPVEMVSWDDCQQFIRKLNDLTGKQFRLPTEAEWEYAARGGRSSRGFKYAGSSSDLGSVAWYDGNVGSEMHHPMGQTNPVGQKQPNELGLYDMSGNVWEWCQDWYDSDYYRKSPSSNPVNETRASTRVLRGGCWSAFAGGCRVSGRSGNTPDSSSFILGLRLAL